MQRHILRAENCSDVIYSILRGDNGNLLSDPKLIEVAFHLQDQGILRCQKEAKGVKITIELGESSVRGVSNEQKGAIGCVNRLLDSWGFVYEHNGLNYDIRNYYCRSHTISGTVFHPYTPFFISLCPSLRARSRAPIPQKGAPLAFEDFYCRRLSAQILIEQLKWHTDCLITCEKKTFAINGHIITHEGTIRHLLLSVLIRYHQISSKEGSPLPQPLTLKRISELAEEKFHEHLTEPYKQLPKAFTDLRKITTELNFPPDLLVERFQENRATFFRLMPYIKLQVCAPMSACF